MLSLSSRACSEVDDEDVITSLISSVRMAGINDTRLLFLSKSGFAKIIDRKAWSFSFFVLDEASVDTVTIVFSADATVFSSEIFTSSGTLEFF